MCQAGAKGRIFLFILCQNQNFVLILFFGMNFWKFSLPLTVNDTPSTGLSIFSEKCKISPTDETAKGDISVVYLFVSCCVSEKDSFPVPSVVPWKCGAFTTFSVEMLSYTVWKLKKKMKKCF